MDVIVRVPGSCGELMQGCLDGQPFLVTCPIERYTEVHVSDQWRGCHGLGTKSLRALQKTCSLLGHSRFPWGIRLRSDLPRGKGMASSSADIAAVAAAVSLAFGSRLTYREILQLAVTIEPTDGVFLPGIVCLDQMHGRILQSYGEPPQLPISVFDTGGFVDTLEFHRRDKIVWGQKHEEKQDIRQKLRQLMTSPEYLAEAAAKSALFHQSVLPKPHFADFLALARQMGAMGVNVAHSGTVIGVIWPDLFLPERIARAAKTLAARYPEISLLCQTHLRGGGIQYKRKDSIAYATFCPWRQYL